MRLNGAEKRGLHEKGTVEAVITLKNTGPMTAKEVVRVYVSDLESREEQVEKELAGNVLQKETKGSPYSVNSAQFSRA